MTEKTKIKPREKKLKILAASDIHGDKASAKRLADQAKKENVDLVILCGDLTFAEMSTEGIVGPFAKAGKKVLIIPGNHETVATTNFLAELYGATCTAIPSRSEMSESLGAAARMSGHLRYLKERYLLC